MTAATIVGRVQELGMGRMWHCWGQVGSYRILHVGDTGGESTVSTLAEVEWDVMGCLVWAGREHQEAPQQDGAGLCLAITTQFHFASSLASGPFPWRTGKMHVCPHKREKGK